MTSTTDLTYPSQGVRLVRLDRTSRYESDYDVSLADGFGPLAEFERIGTVRLRNGKWLGRIELTDRGGAFRMATGLCSTRRDAIRTLVDGALRSGFVQ